MDSTYRVRQVALASMGPGPKGREEPNATQAGDWIWAMLQWGPALKAGRNFTATHRRISVERASMGPGPKGREEHCVGEEGYNESISASMGPGPKGREEPPPGAA